MRATFLFALGSSLAVAAACSSSSTNDISTIDASSDAPAGDENPGYNQDAGANLTTYTPLNFSSGQQCLPFELITTDGLTACHVVLLYPGVASCASVGLSNAPSIDSTYLDDNYAANGAPLPNGAFCALDQLAQDACLADAPAAGWCYVPGGCEADAACGQAACPSSGYAPDGGATYAWLVCP